MVGQSLGECPTPMLTDRALRNLKPDDGPLTDSQVPGLMIRPNANGGKWALR